MKKTDGATRPRSLLAAELSRAAFLFPRQLLCRLGGAIAFARVMSVLSAQGFGR